MRVRNKLSNKLKILFSIIFLLINITILAYLTPGLKGSIEQELRIFFKQTDRVISSSVNQTFKNLYSSFRYININHNIYEKIKIDISFENYTALKTEREKALKLGKNISRKKVAIKILFKNETFRASARLKGGLSDHYGNNKQFSMMIKLKDNHSINGMKEFSLTQHYSRQFPQNIIYSEMLSSLGLATPKFITYKVNLNGDDWGIMLAEEQYSDAYFELRKKKYSPTIKFTNEENSDIFRTLYKTLKNSEEKQFINFFNFKHGKIENNIYNKNDFKNFYYSNILSYSKDIKFDLLKNQINNNKLDTIFDMDKFSKIFILSFIAGEYHALGYRNMRYYTNPFTRKFEPIPTDWGEPAVRKLINQDQLESELHHFINCTKLCNRQDYELYNNIFKNKNFQKNFALNLKLFDEEINQAKIKIKDLCQFQNNCLSKFNSKIIKENLNTLIKEINYNAVFDKNYMSEKKFFNNNPNQSIKNTYFDALKNAVHIRIFNDGKLKIVNLTPYQIEINTIKLIKKNCLKKRKKNKDCIDQYFKKISLPVSEFEYSNFNLNKNLENYESLIVETKYGSKKLKSSKFDIEDKNYVQMKKQKKSKLNEFKLVGNDFIIEKGITYITNPIILPKNFNLKISEGAELVFHRNAYIELEGGKVEAIGTNSSKIYFRAKNKAQGWRGILVTNSNDKSIFKYVVFENVSFYQSFNTHLTGAINFYKADVDFLNTEFINTMAEDFLNITHSKFNIANSKFINCKSDAFDSDFSSGKIIDSEFSMINGDAVDFSGSKVQILSSKFNLIKDKAISAGEISEIYSENNSFSNSKIAIASKDNSSVKVYNNSFLDSRLYDLSAFNKKSFYKKGGEIYLEDTNGDVQLKMKSDLISKIFVNGVKIKNEKFDLKEIY